jgi:hypothetical protein
MKWVNKQVKEALGRPLGACPVPPSPEKRWEAGASVIEAEVCKLNPPPEGDFIKP